MAAPVMGIISGHQATTPAGRLPTGIPNRAGVGAHPSASGVLLRQMTRISRTSVVTVINMDRQTHKVLRC